MNKYKRLLKVIIRHGVIAVAICIACGGLYFLSDSMLDDSEKEKTDAANALSADKGQINTLTTQLEKSGQAEKRFLSTQHNRTNDEFLATTDAFKDYLRNAKTQYRFSNSLKLSLTPDKISDNKEFAGANFDVIEHPGMKLEFGAISDVHVFSFLDDFLHSSPGLIRLEGLSIKRSGDVDPTTIHQVLAGAAPSLVDVRIDFNWIAMRPKPVKESAKPAAAAK